MAFYNLQENLVTNMVKNLQTLQQRKELMLPRILLEEVFKKTAETTGDLIGKK